MFRSEAVADERKRVWPKSEDEDLSGVFRCGDGSHVKAMYDN